ncbi:nucleotidyl transferase AbiEii/AbiGii toxin family protein [Streptomyces albidoflavus]
MANPTRNTTAGRVYNDLRNLARCTSRSTDEVMVEYVLERFLYRLASSPLGREHFVLKGGLLLAQFGARRTTRDIDILGRSFPRKPRSSAGSRPSPPQRSTTASHSIPRR